MEKSLCGEGSLEKKGCGYDPEELLEELSAFTASITAVILSGPPAFFAASTRLRHLRSSVSGPDKVSRIMSNEITP